MTNFNEFLSIALNHHAEVASILDAHKSGSTDSYYFVIKTTDNEMFQLAFSDHYADNHMHDIDDVADNMENDFDEMTEEVVAKTDVDSDFEMVIDDMGYYGIETIEPLDIDPASLIGKYSIGRAFLEMGYIITDAKLSNNDRVLTVTYDDGEVRDYFNFVPTDELVDGTDIAIIKYLIDNYDVHQARGIYYSNQVSAQTEAEFTANFMEEVDDEEADAVKDIFDMLTDQQELLTVNGQNYVVDYAALVLQGGN